MLLALPYIGVISQKLGLDAVIGVAIAVALALDLSINVSFNPTRSIITDVTPEGIARTRGYTWMQTVSGSFGVLAYAIGAVFGNYVLIYFAAGLVVLFSVLPALLIEESRVLAGAADTAPTAEHKDHTSFTRGPAAPDPAAMGIPGVRHHRDGRSSSPAFNRRGCGSKWRASPLRPC